jgi:catechol 2,3-dioxygenase-like lactoylglutathione lyase family enzyme
MRLDHVALVCRDPAATTRFYGELLGLPLTRFDHDGADMLLFALPAGGTLVFTSQPDARPAPTPPRDWQRIHLGLTVASAAELDAWMTRLRTHQIRHELIDNERLYFPDPDGHVLELEVAPPR